MLSGPVGVEASIMPYGAALQALLALDRDCKIPLTRILHAVV